MGDGNGPNSPGLGGDNVLTCSSLCSDWQNCPELAAENMTCFPAPNNQQSVRSMHAGGAYVCMTDGSVQWVSDYIDIAGNIGGTPPVFSIWDRLNASADGMPVPAEAF